RRRALPPFYRLNGPSPRIRDGSIVRLKPSGQAPGRPGAARPQPTTAWVRVCRIIPGSFPPGRGSSRCHQALACGYDGRMVGQQERGALGHHTPKQGQERSRFPGYHLRDRAPIEQGRASAATCPVTQENEPGLLLGLVCTVIRTPLLWSRRLRPSSV